MIHLYLYKLEAVYDGNLYTYYGSRKSKVEPSIDPYTGSPSTKQGRFIFKNPEITVSKIILATEFATYDDLLIAEKHLIEEHYNDKNNLNFSKNPFNFKDTNKKPKTDLHRQKLAETKRGDKNPQFGKPRSPEELEKISASLRGRTPYNKGRKLGVYSSSRRTKMGEGQRLKPRLICPHCQKTGAMNLMNRYHFDNCKKRVTKVDPTRGPEI